MDKVGLGERIARARVVSGLTRETLGRAVGLDRTEIAELEKGDRRLDTTELVSIAEALDRPLAFLMEAPGDAAVSRRSEPNDAHGDAPVLDIELDQFAADVRVLIDMALLEATPRRRGRTPRDHEDAERAANGARRHLRIDDGPIADLGRVCQGLGLIAYSAPLGEYGPDGGCVEVTAGDEALGVAVVNGDRPPGRRRMTLAHELGHWLAGDAYDVDSGVDAERMINSFAIHFLAPRAAVTRVWAARSGSTRDRALAVSAEFRLSWTAAIGQLQNIGLVAARERDELERDKPTKGDSFRLGLRWSDELGAPYLSPGFTQGCLDGYVARRLTSSRVVELLRGTLSPDELPRQEPPGVEDLRRVFHGHGA